eukprot:TRINITY_DN1099_c0_g1_i1.p1 TRINITY_DN1099_c0_g1~~TRINITY_DN1099_c0_g1_i1.p1  ORF type:complete len:145 (+),score=27.08 TRINITY_DN1099_c0_g1_i1:29-436(+)
MSEESEINNRGSASRAIFGFVIWVLSFFVFGMIFLWMFIPHSVFNETSNFKYIPYNYWALAIPASIWIFFFLLVWLLLFNQCRLTPPLHSHNYITDHFAVYSTKKKPNPDSLPTAHDLRINEVSQMFFHTDNNNE